jgi:hypothetical protein
MAIKRCPYCKAIIEEEEKYCNNCGTQLLFPEDEFIEEEIPGKKIKEEEEEFKEEEGEEEEGEELELAEEKEEEKEEKLEAETPQTVPEEEEELPYKTKHYEKIVAPSQEEKDEIKRLLASLKEKKEGKGAEVIEEKILKPETGLPPWVHKLKEPPTPGIPESEELEEKTSEVLKPTLDTGVGLPEVLEQKPLPFEEKIEEKKLELEIETPPPPFTSRLIAKVFDLLCITALWLLSLSVASRLLAVSLFHLISVGALQIFIFYFILIATYFSLFLFFLGGTLGDWLFLKED